MRFAKNLKEAVEFHSSIKTSKISRSRFAGKAEKHFATDYSSGNGLKKLGLDGRETKNFIEFYSDEESNLVIDYMVAVKVDGEWEVFDNFEASGYSSFLLSSEEIARRSRVEREKHYSQKRKENYEPA